MRAVIVGLILLGACATADVVAQTTQGSIRGYVRDEQGGVLPGVTITATSANTPRPLVAVTDQDG